MIIIQREKISDIWEELFPLLINHWEEVEDPFIKEKEVPAPKLERYDSLEQKNMFIIITARDEGKLIGYCGFYLYSHMHYPDQLYAMNDVIFVLPLHRVKNIGVRLMKYAEKYVKGLGANCILWEVRDFRNFSPILLRMGYHKQGTVYMQRFD